MIGRLPFAAYDFFGYLAGGFLFWASVDLSTGGRLLRESNIPLPAALLSIVIIYITGQILAGLSAFIFERIAVDKILGRPSFILFEPKSGLRRLIYPGFYTPLPEEIRERVVSRGRASGIKGPGDGLFLHAFGTVKTDSATLNRLSSFLNQYGFARNVAFTLCMAAVMLGWTSNWIVAAVAGFMGIGMFYRYLKFFRQYAVEVFVSYAASGDK